MFCQNCGNALAPGAHFCNRCGNAVAQGVFASQAAAPLSMQRPGLITFLAVLHFLNGAMMTLFAVVAFATLHDKDPIGLPFGIAFLAWGLLSIVTGIGLWGMREYGRILQIIFAAVGLLAFPVGTILAVLLLVYLTKPGMKVLFSRKSVEQLTTTEADAVRAIGGGAGGAVVAIVVVLVVIAGMGILAAIAIPNLLTAMQRSKQKRTAAEMRTMQVEIESYRADHNGTVPDSLKAAIDGWGTPIRYVHDDRNYWIVSAGKDMKFETEQPQTYEAGVTTNFDADLVIRNGEWLREPKF